jgi:hypothetical protein
MHTRLRWMLVDARQRLDVVPEPRRPNLRAEIDDNLAYLNRVQLEHADAQRPR